MIRYFTTWNSKLDAAYRDHPYFVRVKAKLLAGLALLVVCFMPINATKLW